MFIFEKMVEGYGKFSIFFFKYCLGMAITQSILMTIIKITFLCFSSDLINSRCHLDSFGRI